MIFLPLKNELPSLFRFPLVFHLSTLHDRAKEKIKINLSHGRLQQRAAVAAAAATAAAFQQCGLGYVTRTVD